MGAFLLAACQDNEQTISLKTISDLEKKVFSDSAQRLDPIIGQSLITEYGKFSQLYPSDSLSPEYTFKAGELSLSLNKPLEAFGYFEQVATRFPEYKRASYAIFMKGFIYDGPLNDTALARKFYVDFLNKYPNHPLSKDAGFSLRNLGKTDEELVREFEQKLSEAGQVAN